MWAVLRSTPYRATIVKMRKNNTVINFQKCIIWHKRGYLVERWKLSFRKFYGRYGDLIQQYEVSLSWMLNDILALDQQWLPADQTFNQFHDLDTELDLHRFMSGFHGAFATGMASQLGTLTLPDTWFRLLFWDLLVLQFLRPDSSNLPCLNSTFHVWIPLGTFSICFKMYAYCST